MKKVFKRRQLILVMTAVALCTAVAFGIDHRQRVSAPQLSVERSRGASNSANSRINVQREANAKSEPVPQSGGSFGLSQNVIAGGGGSSLGSGNLQVDGTLGQAAAGTTLSNGQFSLTGGFWQPESGTPTPTGMSFVVTNTNDSGAGSYRQAILDANANPGADTITFNIPGPGVHTISPVGFLPNISDPVTIDGYTQPGASANTLAVGDNAVLLIELNGANGGPDAIGVNLFHGSTTVRGLIINGFSGFGINMENFTGNHIEGNFIGTNSTGSAAVANHDGVRTNTSSNTIGGTAPAARNIISGNTANGILLDSGAIEVRGNYIGTNAAGTGSVPNGSNGIFIDFLGFDTIGGTDPGAGNIIGFNGGAGVFVSANSSCCTAILSNSIHDNGGLGIDLAPAGVTPNDACDADTGPNNLQNFPVLTSATSDGTNTTIKGTLNSTANTQFRIEFFSNSACDASGNGQGKTFLGATNVTTDGSCNGAFQFVAPNASVIGSIITSTATAPDNSTSEFSACIPVVAATPTPTPTPTPVSTTVQFSSASYSVGEGDLRVNIGIIRSGDTSGAATVGFATIDDAGLQNCNVFNGIASPRCDYENTIGTLTFAAGETSKSFSVAIVDDSYAEGNETFRVSLNNPSGATLGAPSIATVTIIDNDPMTGPNPIDNTNFFVRQQYLDFLGREPDPGGFAAWVSIINGCSGDMTQCDRVHVSQNFYQSEEFQTRGYFVYRFYDVAFGQKPDYTAFVPDLARVSGFLDANQLEAAKVAFIADFMSRPAFANKYNSLSNQQYVDTLINTAQVNLSSRQQMIDGLNNSTLTRAQVLRQIVESPEVFTKFNHQAFAVMEYFGYLRRNPDAAYLVWIQVLDQTNDPRGMITGFVNSAEYRQRFGP